MCHTLLVGYIIGALTRNVGVEVLTYNPFGDHKLTQINVGLTLHPLTKLH